MAYFDSMNVRYFNSEPKTGANVANLRVLFKLLAAVYTTAATVDEAKAVLVALGTDSPLVNEALSLVEKSR